MLPLLRLLLLPRLALQAENLFLRRQLGLYREREVQPMRATPWTKLLLIVLSQLFDWRGALVIVKPDTFLRWHRAGFRLFWRWRSRRRGRPPLPKNLGELIRQISGENPTWGQQRIANEFLLKLGVRISPRTVAKYMRQGKPRDGSSNQRWSTFVRNQAQAIVACDYLISVTASFRVLYVFIALEIGSRKIAHVNVTEHPTADWTLQQLREFLPGDETYRYLIHDRGSMFTVGLDDELLSSFGVQALKTPPRTPKANAYCERVIGTIRRECLDFVIPINERHLRRVLREWVDHYNRGRPHSALGPGIPKPHQANVPASIKRHFLPHGYRVTAKPVLGGLHHEYGLEKEVA